MRPVRLANGVKVESRGRDGDSHLPGPGVQARGGTRGKTTGKSMYFRARRLIPERTSVGVPRH